MLSPRLKQREALVRKYPSDVIKYSCRFLHDLEAVQLLSIVVVMIDICNFSILEKIECYYVCYNDWKTVVSYNLFRIAKLLLH